MGAFLALTSGWSEPASNRGSGSFNYCRGSFRPCYDRNLAKVSQISYVQYLETKQHCFTKGYVSKIRAQTSHQPQRTPPGVQTLPQSYFPVSSDIPVSSASCLGVKFGRPQKLNSDIVPSKDVLNPSYRFSSTSLLRKKRI
jgi:hypothetical protein